MSAARVGSLSVHGHECLWQWIHLTHTRTELWPRCCFFFAFFFKCLSPLDMGPTPTSWVVKWIQHPSLIKKWISHHKWVPSCPGWASPFKGLKVRLLCTPERLLGSLFWILQLLIISCMLRSSGVNEQSRQLLKPCHIHKVLWAKVSNGGILIIWMLWQHGKLLLSTHTTGASWEDVHYYLCFYRIWSFYSLE